METDRGKLTVWSPGTPPALHNVVSIIWIRSTRLDIFDVPHVKYECRSRKMGTFWIHFNGILTVKKLKKKTKKNIYYFLSHENHKNMNKSQKLKQNVSWLPVRPQLILFFVHFYLLLNIWFAALNSSFLKRLRYGHFVNIFMFHLI